MPAAAVSLAISVIIRPHSFIDGKSPAMQRTVFKKKKDPYWGSPNNLYQALQIIAVELSSSSKVSMGLLAASLTNALLARPVSLGGRQCFGKFAVVRFRA